MYGGIEMKTISEKAEIVNSFNRRLEVLAENSLQAIQNKDLFATIVRAEELKKIQFQMCEFYSKEVQEALNPMSDMTVPAAIAVLRNTLNFLEKSHPSALEMADSIQKNTECNFREISFQGRNKTNEK